MIWFFQVAIQIESLDQGISLGRLDQYLLPLYQREVAEGTWDEGEFCDLICAFSLKLSEVIPLFSQRATDLFSGLPSGQALCIGGLTAEGDCAANPLSYCLLNVIDKFKMRQPNWHARISKSSNPKFVARVMQVIAAGGGSPALYNDDVIMPALAGRMFDEKSAWDYATVGCVEPALPGCSFTSTDAAIFNMAICLEYVLGQGCRLDSRRSTVLSAPHKKLARITCLDDLMSRLEEEMAAKLTQLKRDLDAIERANATWHPTPFSSLTVDGCLREATDLSAGGALYNGSGIQGVGLADLANSIAAINELVFEKSVYSLTEIGEACRKDFKGQELLRAQLVKAPKFGNDILVVDAIAKRIVQIFDRLVSSYQNTRQGPWVPGFYSMTTHRPFGARMPALPSGRNRGQSLADGISPCDGTDILGPTASLNSVTNADHTLIANGVNLNIKFDSKTLAGDAGASILEALVTAYFDKGGMQVQVNVLDPQVLLEARKDPEMYRNLLVRISGYSAYFVDLTPEMQDEIIQRTLQAV